MAKLSRKQRKKAKKKQVKTLKNQGYSVKQINQFSNKEIEQKYNTIVTEKKDREKEKRRARNKYQKSKELQTWKFYELEKMGIPVENLKSSYLRKVKKSDIEKGNITRENYPFLFSSHGFDFNKAYHFPNGKGLYIAWLDYSGESTIEELMSRFSMFSNETLIEFLKGILETPKQYNPTKKNSGSSGRAGTFRSMITTDNVAKKMLKADNDALKKSFSNTKKRRYHKGVNKYYQNITEDGQATIKKITGRELLIILNAIMYNVTEDSRDMYAGIYRNITNQIPDFKTILPKP